LKQVGQIADFTCYDCLSNMEIISVTPHEERGYRVRAKCVNEDCNHVFSEIEVV